MLSVMIKGVTDNNKDTLKSPTIREILLHYRLKSCCEC